jgi:hypothetical protein
MIYELHEAALIHVNRFKSILSEKQSAQFDADHPDLFIRAMDDRLGPPMEALLIEAAGHEPRQEGMPLEQE